ncbi:MAG: branched-chain amino acid ABC transporter permease [Proteobacteria bacterium]|nr:branched-chain amino acid ABC transporter permease [Pseudomonadota bacterium]MBU1388258.1 branched-chain amino acid ABC transporter permease [Pseudomonadota bacterium]MBU1541853.1 branched-chain amino acid ABC transporter permease [Pseudomonadota bacterium]MBU2430589.1 branched-chain amino acid ABC transporter permease [Pseudomonadota bacterium]MBU2479626.1 branched-chain amino acid ABC transporter permease [Pseudomonadota bacterium]
MDPTTAMYIAQGMHGIAYGMVLFLLASGLTLILGMMGILNLAHTGFFMLAAYFGYQMVQWTGSYWAALAAAPLVTAVFGILMERFLLKKVHVYGPMAELILTMGVSLVILDGVKVIWGSQSLPLSPPESLQGLVNIFGMQYPAYRLFIIFLSLLVLFIMGVLLYKTRMGMIIRAAVSDAQMVDALGINVPVVFMLVFGIGTWMAGVAGVAIAPILTVSPGLASQMGMDAFIVIIVGGFGSLGGAFLVSLICGLLSSYGIQFLPQYSAVLIFIFMAVVLAVKPEGLFGEKT